MGSSNENSDVAEEEDNNFSSAIYDLHLLKDVLPEPQNITRYKPFVSTACRLIMSLSEIILSVRISICDCLSF